MFANSIIKPVTLLADKVNKLERTGDERELSSAAGDEVEILSGAIDAFQHRVEELLKREREFSSDTSHELRTPLMGIQAAAENLQVSDLKDDRVHELADRIVARCKHMRALVEAILYLARDPDSIENDFSVVNLIDVINDQIDEAGPHLENKGVEIKNY